MMPEPSAESTRQPVHGEAGQPLQVRVVDPELDGIQRRRLVILVELDSEIVAVDADLGIVEHGRDEVPGPRHMSRQDLDAVEAVATRPDQRDTKATSGVGHQTVLPGRITAREDGVHRISRPSPLVIDRKVGDSAA